MAVRFQIVMDVRQAAPQAEFWSKALGYELETRPPGFATWAEYFERLGLPRAEWPSGPDSIVDPRGEGPRIWFQELPEAKTEKNRLHFDIRVGGDLSVPIETRKRRVDAEAERLVRLGATRLGSFDEPGIDHYAVAMSDPEGNEFDIN